MWEFVMERAKRPRPRSLIWHPHPRACFGCFRIREKRHFSDKQYRLSRKLCSGEYWRRRCWECLRRFYHPQLADADARARFHRQVLCETCNCLRYVDEDCHGCELKSEQIAEWTRLKRQKAEAKRKAVCMWDSDYIMPSWLNEEDTATEPDQAAVTEAGKTAVEGRN
ncbi:uncharacterized protein B0H64DRAFT_406629 [Chaetomium fimeti]|uniref:Uncharacterized protein n=1 Tax=Chaetomium fimeti TaxID=1854472 RepID=A0AAE0H9S0_9PEZI|nr:hypothetical protein B0H64DRAFT_406629 [Chaetomium fimeti]